jgi:predicted AlkP superfamily phosphohydrolase/phosphomutase/Flp pilus assembly protein TadD
VVHHQARLATALRRLLDATLPLVAAALLATGLAACARGTDQGKLIVLGIDGLDPNAIDLLMSEGRMPNFAKLRQQGAYGKLLSSRPILSPIIWTTIATGKPPAEHKIGHFVAVNEKTGEQIPVTSQMRGVKALWNIVSDAGKTVDVVGWWATWPAEAVNGTIVSDHTCYHFLFDEGVSGARDITGVIYPPERESDILSRVIRPGDLSFETVRKYADVSVEHFARPFSFDDDLGHFKWALATAQSYRGIGLHLLEGDHPDALLVYIEGVDSSSHLFGHLFRNEGLSGELAEQHRAFGDTVERMYEYADSIVGDYLAALDDDTTLVVLSDHGFQLGQLHDDPSKTRDMRRVSEKYHRIEGILYMYGRGVKQHARIEQATLVDVLPTLLTFLGIAPASDMPGRVLDEALTFTPDKLRVATFETGTARHDTIAKENAPVDPAILEHLEALGYLETESPTGERNLAALHFENGRYEEAVEEFRKLLAEKPGDGAMHASLAGALGALGRYDEALEELAEAERLSPLNPEIYHNRGVIMERRGDRDAAVAEYAKALKYAPGYEPSRAALVRLTGSARIDAPSTDAERLAALIAERASDAARRGDYEQAMKELEEARRIAPEYPLVHQYRANVAFLMGNRDMAIEALERALELDPDNALFRQNLEHLRNGASGPPPDGANTGDSRAPAAPAAPASP